MRRLARIGLLALPFLPVLASAQSLPLLPAIGLKVGYSQSDLPGIHGGVDVKIPTKPIRFDADAWSSFADFGKKSAGTALTVNYVFDKVPLVYFGAGLGYVYGFDKNKDHYTSLAGKLFVGTKLPLIGGNIEGALIVGEHPVGMIDLVFKIG